MQMKKSKYLHMLHVVFADFRLFCFVFARMHPMVDLNIKMNI